MRLALYIRTLGTDPVPFKHNDYRDYVVALQQQYMQLRLELGSEIGAQARIAARAEIKKHTLPVAAQGLVPAVPPTPPKPRVNSTPPPTPLRSPSRASSALGTAAAQNSGPVTPSRKLTRKCRRKFVHLDFLSALHHASSLTRHFGDTDLNIYPCHLCYGIHIGHQTARKAKTVHNGMALL